jgi:hypothetical protein
MSRESNYHASASSELDLVEKLIPAQLLVLQKEVTVAWRGSRRSGRLIALNSAMFFGLFFVDYNLNRSKY